MVNDGDMTLSNVIGGPYYPHCIIIISLLLWAPWDDYGIIMA